MNWTLDGGVQRWSAVDDAPRLQLSDPKWLDDPERTALVSLVESWSGHVARFLRELELSWVDTTLDVWGVRDLAAAYYIRDQIESLLVQAHASRPHSVELADAVLVSFTAESAFDWLTQTGDTPGTGWWWQRIPTRGPVRGEIDSWGAS